MAAKTIFMGIVLLCVWSNSFVTTMTIANPEEMESNGLLPEPHNWPTSTRTKREILVRRPNKCFDEISTTVSPFCSLKELKLEKIYSMVKIDEWTKDRQQLKSDSAYLTNESDSPIEAYTHSFQYKKATGESLSVSNTIGLSGEVQLPLPQVSSFTPSLQFSNQETTTKSESIEETMTYPSQKVNLGPRSKVKVHWKIYRNETVQKYRVTFKATPDFQVNSQSVGLNLIPMSGFQSLFTLISGHDPIGSLIESGTGVCSNSFKDTDFSEYSHVKNFEYLRGTDELICKNFEVSRNMYHDEFVVVFGKHEPL